MRGKRAADSIPGLLELRHCYNNFPFPVEGAPVNNEEDRPIERTPNLKVNREITEPEVRLIDSNGKQIGVVPIEHALAYAKESFLDLVEIMPNEKPSVCKLLDYGKHKYRENKKRHEARSKQKQIMVKEVKFRLSTSDADRGTKMRNATRFLGAGDKVKVSLWLRGREIVKADRAHIVLAGIAEDLGELADVEQKSKLEGKRLQMILAPRRDRNKSRKNNAENENK